MVAAAATSVLSLDEETAFDPAQVGGKVAGVAGMARDGIRVAPGFAVTGSAYRDCLRELGISDKIETILNEVEVGKSEDVSEAAQRLEALFEEVELPASLGDPVAAAYTQLAGGAEASEPAVAVRSSATVEDSATASFAGEYETFLGIKGADGVIDAVRRCFASVFSVRAIAYALEQGISPADVSMAVLIQKLVPARSAGVMFTLSPVTGDRSRIVIEGSWGLGEAVVGGEVTPDRFHLDKISLDLVESEIAEKHLEYLPGGRTAPVEAERRAAPCLTEEELAELGAMGKRLEKLRGHPQDIEWAVDGEVASPENVVLLQCRPETVWSQRRREVAYDSSQGVTSWIASRLSPEKRSGAE